MIEFVRARALKAGPTLSIIVAVALATSIAIFLRGWIRTDMASKFAWDGDGATRFAMVSAAYWAIFVGVALTGRRALLLKYAIVAAAAVAAFAGVAPVLVLAVVLVASAAIGYGIWSPVTVEVKAGDLALRTAIGLAVYVLLLPIAALFPINNQLTYFVALAVPVALYGRAVLGDVRWLLGQPVAIDLYTIALLGAIGNFVLACVVASLLPDVGNDALALHLDLAARLKNFGAWHYDVRQHLLALMPLGGDYVYAIAYMFSGEHGARLTNVATLLLLLAITYGAVRDVSSRRVALIATLIAASSPIAVLECASLFVDNPWALFLVGAVVCALRFADRPGSGLLRAAAVLFAAAMATKVLTVGALPALAALFVYRFWRGQEVLGRKEIVITFAAAALLALVPYGIALVKSGNPLFPYYNAIFQSPLAPAVNMTNERFPGELDPALIYRFTFYADRYNEARTGAFGFAWVLLLIPASAIVVAAGEARDRWLLLILIAFVAIVAGTVAYLRYIYPAMFLFAILAGIALHRLQGAAGALRGALIAAAIGAALLNVPFLPAAFEPMRKFELQAIVDAGARHRFIATWAPTRDIVRFLNAYVTDTSPVAILGSPYTAELERRAYLDSWYMPEFRQAAAGVAGVEDVRALAARLDLAFFVIDSTTRASMRTWVPLVSEPLYRVGDATLYKVDTRIRFPNELLKNPRLRDGYPGWLVHGRVVFDASQGAALVDAANLLYQPTPVYGGRQYRLAVDARCAGKPSRHRLQVIWIGANGPIGVWFSPASCREEWTETAEIVTAPVGALTAVVYATGHEGEPVLIRSSSFTSR